MGGRRTAASAPEQPQTKHTRRDHERPSFDGLIRNLVDAVMPSPTQDDYVLFPPWQRPEHPNTVAYSAGAVCCPDEVSARRHIDRATWVEPARSYWTGTTGSGPLRRDVQCIAVATRRWTR